MAVAISNDFLSPLEIVSCISDSFCKENQQLLSNHLGCELHFTSSGSDALLRIFQALKSFSNKQLVAISAYSCPHIAIAAGLAGFKVLPLDTEQTSFEPALPKDDLLQQCAAVVLSNLYGIPDSLDKWQNAVDDKTLIIDDACQSFLSKREDGFVGTTSNVIGVISFGRGKPLPGVGGGAIVENPNSSNLAKRVFTVIKTQTALAKTKSNAKAALTALAYWTATRRLIFELLLKSPLDIGKPDCPETIEQSSPSIFELSYLAAQSKNISAITQLLKNNAAAWGNALNKLPAHQVFAQHLDRTNLAPIRYPLICTSAHQCQQALAALRKNGIGATAGYRQLIQDWSSVASYLVAHPQTTNARAICDRVMLLPNHSQVQGADILDVAKLLRATLK